MLRCFESTAFVGMARVGPTCMLSRYHKDLDVNNGHNGSGDVEGAKSAVEHVAEVVGELTGAFVGLGLAPA